jgi:hypothetical protein
LTFPLLERPAWTRFLPARAQDSVDDTASVRFSSAHAGQSVLVTGAGRYIGSALAKAIAAAEEIVYKTETKKGTLRGPLDVFKTCRPQIDVLAEIMRRLSDSVAAHEVPALIRTLCEVVPEYVPSGVL